MVNTFLTVNYSELIKLIRFSSKIEENYLFLIFLLYLSEKNIFVFVAGEINLKTC